MKQFLTALLPLALATVTVQANGEATQAEPKLAPSVVSESMPYTHQFADVLDNKIAYIEDGKEHKDTVLFIHGNPTSSYLWRNVIPYIAKDHHAVALDLIGMGRSSKPVISYSFEEHFQYFSSFIDTLNVEKITLVGHDWGAALAWEYARTHPNQVQRIVFMEGVLPPAFPVPSYEAMQPEMENMFRAFNDPIRGPELVIDGNMFVEQVLPGFVNRPLGKTAMNVYRAPFLTREERSPTLAWPRQIPIQQQPANTFKVLNKISAFMGQTDIPSLLLYASPGVVTPPEAVAWYQQTIAQLDTAFIGQGLHFVQEDQPEAIGRSIQDWLRKTAKH